MGTASITKSVIPAIIRSEFNEVSAIASRDRNRAGQWAKHLNIPKSYGSYEDMLATGGFDIVYNPLPNSMHAQWTINVLKAGYPVLCEKPFALNKKQAEDVMKVSKKTGLPVAEAFMYRFHPMFNRVKEIIANNIIGDIVSIDSRFSFFEDDRSSIVRSSELGGGALMDVGCYCVNLSRTITGTEPIRVTALKSGQDIDETMMGILKFPNILARFETSIVSSEQHEAEICGTKGIIRIPEPWLPGMQETQLLIQQWGKPDQVIPIPGADTYRLEIEDFSMAVRTGNSPRWTVNDAIANMAVIDALFESSRTGHHVMVEK